MIAALVAQLETIGQLKGRVQRAAKLADLTRQGATFQQDRAAFVLPFGLRGSEPDAVTGMFRQTLDRLFAVVLMLRNQSDATGAAADTELEPLIEAVVQKLSGWGPDDAFGTFVLASGELISIANGTITFQLNFGLADQLRIVR